MTNTAILAASALLLFAYLLDIFGRHFRLPAVVLLIVTGIVLRQVLESSGVHLRWIDPIVPVLGTLGLILIVLEGALDLNVSRDRMRLMLRSAASALLGFVVTAAVFTALFRFGLGLTVPVAALAGLICLYALGKHLHLSPLIMVLGCGLLLNNPHLIDWNARLRSLHSADYDHTLKEFKSIVVELTFATKSFFFLLLGYWTDLSQMTSGVAWALAAAVVATIYATRWVLLRVLRQPDRAQLLWIAPRGLITVLLILTAVQSGQLDAFPFGAVMLVVLVTSAATALAQRRRGQ